jgi:hypothetical protein
MYDKLLNNKILWVASYPKSGNTWIRFLLANLLCGPINNSQQIDHIIPDMHHPIEKYYAFEEVLHLKTHWKYDKISSLNFKTIGAIYIYRNPLDVIASHINYWGLTDDMSKKNLFIEQFINSYGAPKWIAFDAGTWIENIKSWVLQQKDFPYLILRYEDIQINPYEAVLKMCKFLCLDKKEPEISMAIKQSSFENLRSMEEKELSEHVNGFFLTVQDRKDSQYRFINKGKIGNFRQLLSDEQIKRVVSRFSSIMEILGYSIEATDYIRNYQ